MGKLVIYCKLLFSSVVSIFLNFGNNSELQPIDDHEFPSNVAHALQKANSMKLLDHEGKPFSIFLNMKKLIKECPSCAVYFQLARYLFIILLVFMIVFAGAVAGVSYYTCTKENFINDLDIFKGIGGVIGCTYYGGVFRQNQPELSLIHSLTYLGWIATSYILIVIFMIQLEVMAVTQNKGTITSSDFSLIFRKLPNCGLKLEDIQQLIDTIDNTCRVVKIEKIYEIPDAQGLVSKQQKLEYLVQKMEEKNENPKVLRESKKNLAKIVARISRLRSDIKSESLFTGSAFVTFETMEQADKIYSKYTGGFWQMIKRNIVFALSLTLVDYSYKKNKWKVNGKMCAVKRPPVLPEEVIWENYFKDKTRGAKTKIRLYLEIVMTYLIFGFLAGFGYVFSYNNAVEIYFKNDTYQVYDLYSTFYISMYLIAINFVARKILSYLSNEIREEDLLAGANIKFIVLIIHFLVTYVIVHYSVLFWVVKWRLNEYKTSDDTGDATSTNIKSYIFVTRSLFVLSAQFIGDIITDKFLSILKCICLRFYSMVFESRLIQYECNANCQLPVLDVIPSLSTFVSILIFMSFYANVTWVVTIIPMCSVIVDYWLEKFFIFQVYQAPKRTPLSVFANSFKLILIFNFLLSALTNFYPIPSLFGEYKISNLPVYIILFLFFMGSSLVFHIVYSPQAVKDRARLGVKGDTSYKSLKFSDAVTPDRDFAYFNPLSELLFYLQSHQDEGLQKQDTMLESIKFLKRQENHDQKEGMIFSESPNLEKGEAKPEAMMEMGQIQKNLETEG